MLNSIIKRHIKLLAERFDHTIRYDNEKIILFNDKNTIEIEPCDKEKITILYNTHESLEEVLHVENIFIYDPLIELLKRTSLYKIEFIRGDLVELKDFVNEESIAKKSIKSLKEEWKINNEIECMDLGGNRFEVEYYKGILILIDDLPNCKLANVIDIKINEL
jgi:hypothetical protein